MTAGLTRQQSRCLAVISASLAAGVSPSLDEIASAMGMKSKSRVNETLGVLEAKGYIRRMPRRARAIEVLRPEAVPPRKSGLTTIRHGGQVDRRSIPSGLRLDVVTVPFDLPSGVEHVAFDVFGDAMIDAGLLFGDLVVVQRIEAILSGHIVVAVIDGAETVLRRYRAKGETVMLEAANPAYESRIFTKDRIEIIGRVVGMVRRYQEEN